MALVVVLAAEPDGMPASSQQTRELPHVLPGDLLAEAEESGSHACTKNPDRHGGPTSALLGVVSTAPMSYLTYTQSSACLFV